MSIIQRKSVDGEIHQWEIDVKAVQATSAWAAKNSSLLNQEISEMDKYFPYFYLTRTDSIISSRSPFCLSCGELISFENGLRCIGCGETVSISRDSLLAYIGQIPSFIGSLSPSSQLGDKAAEFIKGRPYLKQINSLLQTENSVSQNKIKKLFLAQHHPDRTDVYFSPIILACFPDNWPRSAPQIMLPKDYFQILFHNSGYSQSDFHAYSESSSDLYRLCLYSSWHTLTMRVVLQQRIVPKIIIDLMIADLLAVGKLEKVLTSLGTSTHELYNWVGKEGKSEQFKRQYDKYVKI